MSDESWNFKINKTNEPVAEEQEVQKNSAPKKLTLEFDKVPPKQKRGAEESQKTEVQRDEGLFKKRVIATVIDLAIMIALYFSLTKLYALYCFLGLIIVSFFFFHRSVGKLIMKIMVAHRDGGRASFFQVLLRELIGKPLALLTIIGALLVILRKDGRGLHDFLFVTIVEPID